MNTKNKILTINTLKRKIQTLRKEGCVIAWTNGCFDILHYGHISYLQSAKKKNRILIVGLNSDKSVHIIKGSKRPIISQIQRALVLAALSCVDYITIFDEATPTKCIEVLKPDVLIKGADWKGQEVAGADIVKAAGGKVEFIKYIPKSSSTNIIQVIIERCQEK